MHKDALGELNHEASLLARYGVDIAMADLLREIAADCPRARGVGSEGCGAHYVGAVDP